MNEKILITICARGGSKGVKGKNIRELLGRPLLAYTLDHARAWGRTTDIYLSTDSPAIADAAKSLGLSVPRLRDQSLSGDAVGKLDVIRDAILLAERDRQTRYDIIVDLDVTAPLRSVEDIEGCYQMLLQKDYDVVLSGCEARRNPYFNLLELDEKGRAHISKSLEGAVLSRQSAPAVYEANASIYVYRRSFFDQAAAFCVGPNTGIYVMPTERSWDIDHEEDLAIVEVLMKRLETRNKKP